MKAFFRSTARTKQNIGSKKRQVVQGGDRSRHISISTRALFHPPAAAAAAANQAATDFKLHPHLGLLFMSHSMTYFSLSLVLSLLLLVAVCSSAPLPLPPPSVASPQYILVNKALGDSGWFAHRL
jgi:hypothetical protein